MRFEQVSIGCALEGLGRQFLCVCRVSVLVFWVSDSFEGKENFCQVSGRWTGSECFTGRYYLTPNVLSLLSEGSHSKRRDSTVENTYFNTAFQLSDKTVLRGLGTVEAFVVAFVTNCPGALHIHTCMYVQWSCLALLTSLEDLAVIFTGTRAFCILINLNF